MGGFAFDWAIPDIIQIMRKSIKETTNYVYKRVISISENSTQELIIRRM